jgi:hypothetical protein
MGRDGYGREAAVGALAGREATGFLFCRLDDPVAEVAAGAARALEPRLSPERAGELVDWLPLLTWLGRRARGRRSRGRPATRTCAFTPASSCGAVGPRSTFGRWRSRRSRPPARGAPI